MKQIFKIIFAAGITGIMTFTLVSPPSPVQAQGQEKKPETDIPKPPEFEGSMTLKRIDVILKRLDKQTKQSRKGVWEFKIENTSVILVTDENYNRMRIVIGIKQAASLTKEELLRLSQANFDSALDSRYAIARGVLWAVYIHPLHALYDKQFISAIAQTVNAAKTYGTSYSSGAIVYGGGDSENIRKSLIEKLQKKGLEI